MPRVAGKVALVTGAGKGIGEATARTLAREGAAVVLTDVDAAAGAAAADAIAAEFGGQTLFLPQDVADEERWGAVVAEVIERFGRLDILVNNAGIGTSVNVEEETLAGWRRLQSINLDAVFLGTQAAIAAMKAGGGGSIVNISSIEGLVGDPNLPAYNASKGGVRLFTKSAALHCAKAGYGIRVNSVHPGYIKTPLITAAFAASEEGAARLAALTDLHPIGRLGEPEEVANAILFLASEESSFVTGSELVVDGGYTAQ